MTLIKPEVFTDFDIKLQAVQKHVFENGSVLYNYSYDLLPVAKIEFVFPAGKKYQMHPLVAHYAGKMLFEGTTKKNHQQIVSEFDLLGASVNCAVQEDFASLYAVCLSKHVDEILKMIHHVLTDSVFPQHQLDILTQNDKQEFLVNSEKVSFLSKRLLFQSVFSNNHPYTRFAVSEDYDNLDPTNVKEFYDHHYGFENCKIFWTGKISKHHFKMLENMFGKQVSGKPVVEVSFGKLDEAAQPGRYHVEKKDAKQSAIYIGKEVCSFNHPDYYKLSVANTILGGYFGSRLMKNIREEKGYTYGIGSQVISYMDASLFIIGSQVKAEHTEDALNEINKEIKRLQNEPVEKDELELVKNYLKGTLMQSLDGPFAQTKFHSLAIQQGRDPYEMLDEILLILNNINTETILELSNTYLKTDELFFAIAGKI